MQPCRRRAQFRTAPGLAVSCAALWPSLLAAIAGAQGLGAVSPEEAAQELGIDLTEPLLVDDCIAVALLVHPDIRVAASDLARSLAGVRQARAAWWPSISASTDYRVTEQPTRTAVVGGSVIPVGGGRATSKNTQITGVISPYQTGRLQIIRQAERIEDSARAGVEDTRRRLAYLITQAYYDRLAAERLVVVNDASTASAREHVDMVQARIDAGDGAPVEIHAVRTQLHQSELALSAARNQAEIARAALWSALGEPGQQIEVVDTWAEPSFLPELDDCVEAAFIHRPDLAQAEAGVRAARLGVKLARLRKLPELSVYSSGEYGRHDGQSGTSWSIYGSIEQSIFDGGANDAGVRQAKSQLESALAQLDRLNQSIRLEVETSWLQLRQSAESIAVAEFGEIEARASLDAAEERYQANVGILLEVTDAQARLTDAEISVVRAYYDYNTALADLEQGMGITLPELLPAGEE